MIWAVYPTVLWLHSAFRWVVILFALYALLRALRSARGPWTPADERAFNGFAASLGIQGGLGLLLYFWLSPIPRGALHDFGAAMKDPMIRFWIVEHAVGMIASIALAQIGNARIRRATDPARKRRLARVFMTLSILLMLGSIPWPDRPYGRPLFRGF
jgi:heme A synthase